MADKNKKNNAPAAEAVRRFPQIETKINKSKDGKWVIIRTVITDMRSTEYFRKVVS